MKFLRNYSMQFEIAGLLELSYCMTTLVNTLQDAHKSLLAGFKWEVFKYPPCSPNLTTSDFYLFPNLKEILNGIHLESDD